MERLDLNDIQGLILYGYGKFAAACYVLLQIQDPAAAKGWLADLAPQITSAIRNPSEQIDQHPTCLNLAFTQAGLRALHLDETALAGFSREFQEGMVLTEHRQRLLGDIEDSAPEHWSWGGNHSTAVHLVLMLYAVDQPTLEQFYQTQVSAFSNHGLTEVTKLDTQRLPNRREHFGFRDDIADPIIAGTDRQGNPNNTINAGEFILGYQNGYQQYTNRPLLPTAQDPQALLPEDLAGSGLRDLGRNGSYLVFRQLSQDVQLFWQYLDQAAKQTNGSNNPTTRLQLAAKMVGRWPSGAPLVEAPEQDNPALANQNDFLYHTTDADGVKCPFAAHIRRTNPRDALEPEPGSQETLDRTNRHRILRRGRAYGPPVAASMTPEDILNAPPDHQERGIHFICFNANIGRQFEFIQHTWINNPKFDGLYSEDDPLMGDRAGQAAGKSGTFTVQATPVRQQVSGLPRFVQVRGGAYFFMPGIRAVRFLAALP
jgi:Dyp-type peroxidase family